MMSESLKPDDPLTWQTLNAYVDQELDARARAEVASRAAADAAIAARIATLSQLKANTRLAEQMPIGAPPIRRRRRLQLGAVAWVAAVAVIVAITTVLSIRGPAQPENATWLAEAVAAQKRWLAAEPRSETEPHRPLNILISRDGRPFDLSEADLVPVYAATPHLERTPRSAFVGYRGPHGCLVGLWVGERGDELTPIPKSFDVGAVLVRAWRNSSGSYALLSEGMDPRRMDRLAAIVGQISDPAYHFGEDARVALRQVPHTGRACRG